MATKTVALTIYDRTPEVISAVVSSLSFPGNRPDTVAVCYDRAPFESREAMRRECDRIGVELVESALNDDFRGPRCPSLAWNTVMATVESSHALCISSDMVLTPHSLGMAYQLSAAAPNDIIVGRADHCGTSYEWNHIDSEKGTTVTNRTMCSSAYPNPLGFVWLIPLRAYRAIGGYDESFMRGVCYEDTDFTIRMWEHGCDFIFCDDVAGFHIEHRRDHLRNEDGRVKINCDLFNNRYKTSREDNCMVLKNMPMKMAWFGVGMCAWAHAADEEKASKLVEYQRRYCENESWHAITPNIVRV